MQPGLCVKSILKMPVGSHPEITFTHGPINPIISHMDTVGQEDWYLVYIENDTNQYIFLHRSYLDHTS